MKAVSYLGLTLLEARKRYLEIIAVSLRDHVSLQCCMWIAFGHDNEPITPLSVR